MDKPCHTISIKEVLEFRLDFIKEEYDETREATGHGRCRRES